MRRRIAAVATLLAVAGPACASSSVSLPGCKQEDDSAFVLLAQSVPTATQLPCIKELPVGWIFSGSEIRDDGARMWLDSTIAGAHAVEIDLRSECEIADAVEVPPAPDEVGMRAYVQPDLPPGFSGLRYLVFDGGCVIYRYSFAGNAPPTLALEAEEAVSFLPRQTIVDGVDSRYDQILCGAGAPRCAG